MVMNMFSKEAIAQEYRKFLQMKESERKEKEEELKKRQLEKKLCETNCENEIERSQDSFELQEVEFITREKKTDNKKKKIIIGCVCGIIVIGLMIGITTIFQKLNTKIPAEITNQSGITSNTNLIQQTKGSIEPYVKMIGTVTQDKNVTVAESFLNNIDKVKIMGRKGTVSHGFTVHSGDKIAMMDWKSNNSISVEEYNKFTKSLDEFFGEEAEVQQYDNISDGECLVWNDLENRCWVIGWYDNNAYLRWYGKDFWNH